MSDPDPNASRTLLSRAVTRDDHPAYGTLRERLREVNEARQMAGPAEDARVPVQSGAFRPLDDAAQSANRLDIVDLHQRHAEAEAASLACARAVPGHAHA